MSSTRNDRLDTAIMRLGIAVVALILSTATEAVLGFQGVYWFLAAVLAAILAATWFLPGNEPPADAEPRAKSAAGAVAP